MSLGNADVGLLALIAVSTVLGLFRGLLREATSLLIWGLSLFVSYSFAAVIAPSLARIIGNTTMAFPAAMLVLFVLCLLVGALAQRLGGKLLVSTGLSGVDRLLGMLFGAARGGIVAIVLLIAVRPFLGMTVWWQESPVITWLLGFEDLVLQGVHSLTRQIH